MRQTIIAVQIDLALLVRHVNVIARKLHRNSVEESALKARYSLANEI